MANKDKFKVKQIIAALEKSWGMSTYAAKILGCNRHTIKNYINRHPEIQEALDDILEARIDTAEFALDTLVRGAKVEGKKGVVYQTPPDLGAICFFLKCKAKNRGYVERQEITGVDGGPLTIIFEDADKMTE